MNACILRLDDHLLARAKALAARTGRTLTAVVEDALRAVLSRERRRPRESLPDLPTFGSGGTLPGVDLDDSAGLLDVMESGGADA